MVVTCRVVRDGAQLAAVVSTLVMLPCAAVVAYGLVLLKNHVGEVFTSDPSVELVVRQIVPLVGATYAAMGAFHVLKATLMAQGRLVAWLRCLLAVWGGAVRRRALPFVV